MKRESFWEGERLTLEQSIEMTIADMQTYGPRYKHWAIAYSGGKDSSATVTLIAHLIATGAIAAPESLTVLYADTRMELPPLHACAMNLLQELQTCGIKTEIVLPALDDRFFVYLFGRGVPAPKNRFRWCTPQLKIEPMEKALAALRAECDEKYLMFTGVRLGESVIRDQRIALSCTKDGAECGQGWFQRSTPGSIADTLAPCLHWRVCHVWDWLMGLTRYDHGFSTALIAEAYGGDEAEEINARTGCIGCNLASKDVALDTILKLPQWHYLAPLKQLKPLYEELQHTSFRLRKDGSQRLKNGAFPKNPMRMGPYTMEARRYGLEHVLALQSEVNSAAHRLGRPTIDLINDEEHQRIIELMEANTWPNGWSGDEVRADVLIPHMVTDSMMQPLLEMEERA
jgi:DNA sulfur modification protein DndC